MSLSTRRNSSNGLKKYPASEYSDRVMNLNKLEDRNLENTLKYIEKERNIALHNINRDIKKLEEYCDEKETESRKLYNYERRKYLSNNLHNSLLNNSKYDIYKKSNNKDEHDLDEREYKENIIWPLKNHSANSRLNKTNTDPAIFIKSNSKLPTIPRSRSSFDLFEGSSLLDSYRKSKVSDDLEQRPNSSDAPSRHTKFNFEDRSKNKGFTILPRAPIAITENTIKKNFSDLKEKFARKVSNDSTLDGKLGNISPMSVSLSPVPHYF